MAWVNLTEYLGSLPVEGRASTYYGGFPQGGSLASFDSRAVLVQEDVGCGPMPLIDYLPANEEVDDWSFGNGAFSLENPSFICTFSSPGASNYPERAVGVLLSHLPSEGRVRFRIFRRGRGYGDPQDNYNSSQLYLRFTDSPAAASEFLNPSPTLAYIASAANFDDDSYTEWEEYEYSSADSDGRTFLSLMVPGYGCSGGWGPFGIEWQIWVDPSLTANDDEDNTSTNASVTTNVLANDTYGDNPVALEDLDGPPTIETVPQNGTVTVNPDGTITYMPNPGFRGVDTYQYSVTKDPSTDTALVTINVSGHCPWWMCRSSDPLPPYPVRPTGFVPLDQYDAEFTYPRASSRIPYKPKLDAECIDCGPVCGPVQEPDPCPPAQIGWVEWEAKYTYFDYGGA